MEKVSFIERKKGRITVGLEIIVFKENDSIVVYSPSLDLSSYGETEKDAQKAFKHDLMMFLEYTSHKRTLEKELTRLGWKKIPSKKHEFQSPEFDELQKQNNTLDCIIANKEFNKVHQNYALALQ